MKTIYKYPIEIEANSFYIEVPKDAKVISAIDINSGGGVIYAIVDPSIEETVKREVIWFGTGWDIDKDSEWKIGMYDFLGTFRDGYLTWHLWIESEIGEV